jgi:hypothetical protein
MIRGFRVVHGVWISSTKSYYKRGLVPGARGVVLWGLEELDGRLGGQVGLGGDWESLGGVEDSVEV